MSLESDFRLIQGAGPLVISVPHAGTAIPHSIAGRMTPAGRASTDSDRYVDRLYEGARELGATMLIANWSRYVVDLNRPPDDRPLYPGRFETKVCPLTTFDGRALYLDGKEPRPKAATERVERYWRPYHKALLRTLEQTIDRHGFALLWDAHSIRDRIPELFDGVLPDLNLGTNGGASCDPRLLERLKASLAMNEAYSSVVDGRFTGGYITRHYGRPDKRVHAVQMELTQPLYMDQDPPFTYRPVKAGQLSSCLLELVRVMALFDPAKD